MMSEKNIEWEKMLNALTTTHTLSIRRICQILKTNRVWVSAYVLPYIMDNRISIPTGKGKNANKNWLKLVQSTLNRPDMYDTTWYSRQEFDDLMARSIYSVTRQTIRVPVELFVKDKEQFKKEYEGISREIQEAQIDASDILSSSTKTSLVMKLIDKQEGLWLKKADERLKDVLEQGRCSEYKRTQVAPVAYEYDNIVAQIDKWIAPHDIKDYGDTDEAIFRRFFREGFIRIELALTDKNDKKCYKVFYIEDNKKIRHTYVPQYVTFNYAVWRDNQEKIFPH